MRHDATRQLTRPLYARALPVPRSIMFQPPDATSQTGNRPRTHAASAGRPASTLMFAKSSLSHTRGCCNLAGVFARQKSATRRVFSKPNKLLTLPYLSLLPQRRFAPPNLLSWGAQSFQRPIICHDRRLPGVPLATPRSDAWTLLNDRHDNALLKLDCSEFVAISSARIAEIFAPSAESTL